MIPTTQRDVDARARRRFLLALSLLTLVAWLLREYFVLATVVEDPIRGDVRQYVAYAWNLLHHGKFSQVWPGSGMLVSDTFRGPGYPWFLALCMAFNGDGWYQLALNMQAVLGALTVALTVLLARHWLSPRWALAAGILIALWPHHIAATGALLSEVVLGFSLMLALLLAAQALQRKNLAWAIASGLAFSYAALVSTVSLPFPLLVALLFWREAKPRPMLALVLFALLAPALWGVRDATIKHSPDMPGRATMNLVQGSWPQYHRARVLSLRYNDQIARDIMGAIDHEEKLLDADLGKGLATMAERMAYDPKWYIRWYLLQKPFLLWDWDIRMGAGGVYFLKVNQPPLQTNPILRISTNMLKTLNPCIFALSAAASILLLFGWLRARAWAQPAAALVAAFCIYVTAVHVVFQAEPRFAIPYRPMQMLMLASALAMLASWGRSRFAALKPPK